MTFLTVLQDVDARLTRDVERLSDGLSQLIPSMVKPVVDIAWFTVQLARLTGARGMAILYAYALGGLLMLRLVTPDFGALANRVQPPACYAGICPHAKLLVLRCNQCGLQEGGSMETAGINEHWR